MHFIISCLKGIAIGAGAILPGISSGVFCVIFGIYEKLLNSILYFFKDIKNNFKFLLPIVVGVFIGVLIFSNFLNYFFINFPIQTNDCVVEKKLAKISGNKKVQMIPQKDLQKTTGYVHGANNPVGIRQKHNFPIYIDQSAQEAGFLIVSAGEIGRSIRINSQELADFVNAEFADIKE